MTDPKPRTGSFREAFRFWVKFISFGGPAGQLAICFFAVIKTINRP